MRQELNPILNEPQAAFLSLPQKFRAYVAGFGCVREDTEILTASGFKPISEVSFGDAVVSWNQRSQKFRLSPTSGGFPKGKANLYRVVTTRGEFVASGHHRICVSPDRYERIDALSVGQTVFSFSEKNKIIGIEKTSHNEWFWDIHVAGDNNYLTRDLTLHHNSGKTWAGCASLGRHFCEWPGINAGYFAPTYPQIRDIFYPTVAECFEQWGLSVDVKQSAHEVFVYSGRTLRGVIKCRSMDKPESIIGFKIGHALVDEIDVMPVDKATVAWRKILARMRYNVKGLRNGIDVTTTPEGFKFVYQQFEKGPRENPELRKLYGIIKASTYDNEINLPPDYIPSLMESYPAQLIDAYINGEFVNLDSGTIYCSFKREYNATDVTIQPGEPLFIGMDFNVGHMAAVVHVRRNGLPCAVDEFVNGYDTPDMIRRIKERYWRYDGVRYVPTCQIRIYPDASGDSRRSVNASQTDIALLREAGFAVSVNATNPPVKDRVNAMNAMFCNSLGERRYLVNPDKCPSYIEALEQQPWGKNGEPDKTTGHDHINDAAGYFIAKEYPIIRNTMIVGTYSTVA